MPKTPPKLKLITRADAKTWEPDIMWPPASGVPDVIFVAGKTFVACPAPRGVTHVYREAKTYGITGFDFK